MTRLFKSHTLQQGFTLIEILIALVILSVALTAANYAVNLNIRNAAYIDNKIMAHWVATNVLSQYQINPAMLEMQDGTSIMLNKTWYWKAQIETTTIQNIHRIVINVSPAVNKAPIEHLEGYLYDKSSEDA